MTGDDKGKHIPVTIGVVIAILGSWVGVAGFTSTIVQRQTQSTILAVAIDARAEARLALQRLQDPSTGVESRVTRLEALQEEQRRIQEETRRTLTEIRADVKKLLEER